MAEVKKKSIEERYTKKDEIEHILHRPGMYIGSVLQETSSRFIYSDEDCKFIGKDVSYTPALLKIIDEAISNSCDEFRRSDNMGLTDIYVTIDNNGKVIIKDNGGIPIVVHGVEGIYVPEFIFGTLRSSSNYDDSEDRDVVGTNGLGVKLLGICSKNFCVYSADGKKSYKRTWSNNLRVLNDDMVVEKCKDHFTELTIDIDMSLFEDIDEISDDFIDIIEKRCIDAAAANNGLTLHFKHTNNGELVKECEWHFNDFREYIDLYSELLDDVNSPITFKDKQKSVWIFPSGSLNVGFVNGAECSKGTHIKAVRNEINNTVSKYISEKEKLDVQPKDVNNQYSMFCMFHVVNPSYTSQTKEELFTTVEKFDTAKDYKFAVPQKFLDDICKSDIIPTVISWFKQKQEVEDQKTLRKLNKQAKQKVRNSDKFIDANSRKNSERELWIFEGDSARSGFRMARNPQTQAAYMLRGVIMNVLGLTPSKIMANKELNDLVTIIGLQWGVKNLKENLNFSRLVISTDADYDGSKIAGLLLVFFNLFPELFEQGMVCRSITPIITARKGADVRNYYKLEDFKLDEKNLKGYSISYNKGLGGQSNAEYKQMMLNPKFVYFTKDDIADMSINAWFGKGKAEDRKNMLSTDN